MANILLTTLPGFVPAVAQDISGKANIAGPVVHTGSHTFQNGITVSAASTYTGIQSFANGIIIQAGTMTINAGAGFVHNGATVTLANSLNWRISVNVGLATALIDSATALQLSTSNNMTRGVIDAVSTNPISAQISDIGAVVAGDMWEICQNDVGVITFLTTTTVVGQVVTLRYPPGGGPKSAGRYSTIFARVRQKAGSGAAATAELFITGGLP